MTNKEAISILKTWRVTGDKEHEALDMAISALEAQELKQEVKNSGCTYKPDCPWYDGSKCNSPNDHGYHECDYDRGIFPESYEELSNNSTKLNSENGEYLATKLQQGSNQTHETAQNVQNPKLNCLDMQNDLISRKAAIDEIVDCTVYGNADDLKEAVMQENAWNKWSGGVLEALEAVEELPSAQPETGYWISARDEDGRHMWLICSECRAKETNLKAKYCPVCGRKMA